MLCGMFTDHDKHTFIMEMKFICAGCSENVDHPHPVIHTAQVTCEGQVEPPTIYRDNERVNL